MEVNEMDDAMENEKMQTDTECDVTADAEIEKDVAAECATEEKPDKKEEKAKLFGKKPKPEKKQDKQKEMIEELEDRIKRQMAEFENFRKRTEKEKATMYEIGAKNVIEKILPVVDNFERGLQTLPKEEENTPFAEGISMVYKQLMTELDSLGVKVIEAVGTEFDPEFHNAVMQVESEEFESGIVAQELQKGYIYHDSVVRHSMVAVVQ